MKLGVKPMNRYYRYRSMDNFKCLARIAFVILLFTNTIILYADITDATLDVTTDPTPVANAKFNEQVKITFTAQWKGDTPPYAATFYKGNTALGTVNTNQSQASLMITGTTLGDGTHTGFNVIIIETSQINPKEGKAQSTAVVNIDTTAPTITVTREGTGIFSNNPPYNEFRFTVRISGTDKKFGSEPTITIEPTNVGISYNKESNTDTEYVYKVVLSGAAAGNYTIKAVGVDNTIPESGRKIAVGTANFIVKTEGPTPPTIASVSPGIYSKETSIDLSGTAGSNTVSIRVFDNGSIVTTVVPNSDGKWTAGISRLSAGVHNFTAVGVDNLGNLSQPSAPFTVYIDLQPPKVPVLIPPKSPTNQTVIDIEGTDAIEDPSSTVKSNPVKVILYKISSSGSPTLRATYGPVIAGSDGRFKFTGINLDNNTDNVFYAQAFDSAEPGGNASGYSSTIIVRHDGTAPPSAGTSIVLYRADGMLASMPIPIGKPPWLGVGNFNLQITFSEDMDNTVNPNVGIKPANGTEIVTNAGTWTASRTFTTSFSIPASQHNIWDGAASLRVFGAKDLAGNTMEQVLHNQAFYVDTKPPVTTQSSMDTIYVGSNTTSITLTGTAVDGTSDDSCSGVGYVNIIYQSFSGGSYTVATAPIFNGASVEYSYNLNVAGMTAGKYKLWARSADQAKPNPNIEELGNYRILIVAKDHPSVERISFDDELIDINEGGIIPTVASDVNKLVAKIKDNGGAGINFNIPPFVFRLQHLESSTVISGNYTNNGSDTITFTFPKITMPGTYTVTVLPVDKAGNTPPSPRIATFIYDNIPPSNIYYDPPTGAIVQENYPPIATDEVWVFSKTDPNFGYTSSTLEVTYNGTIVGSQKIGASSAALIWDLYGADKHPTDQSGDGRYDITVIPKDIYGNTGPATKSFFILDTQGPVVIEKYPSNKWIGLDVSSMSFGFSDAPKDISLVTGLPEPLDPVWRLSKGSGVNLASSSLKLIQDGVQIATGVPDPSWAPGSSATASLIIVNFKNNVAYNLEGVTTLTAEISAADNVRMLSPNIRNASYSYMYDFYRPQFTFVKPKPNAKYCKHTIAIEADVTERGTARDLLKVVSAKARAGSLEWISLTSNPSFPSYSASATGILNVSSISDGPLTIYGTCVDLAGNESSPNATSSTPIPTTVTVTIDRTPPVSPVLILPLNDSVHASRGLRFKWSKVNDADKYLIQIADDPAFSNIINHLPLSGYSERGQIVQMPEAAFTLPKDGTFYWRVASIETCEDGYNIGSFTQTWKFTVDTVKPRVISVQPTPSSGNKITTGLVTFTIRFSEKMDLTAKPVVSLTSAGGQLMLIEQVSYKDDTWIGTTVIPKNDSAMYDGNAVISISEAKDLAGNVMEPDTSNMVIINTAPAFEIKLFSNPANENEIVIVVRSTETLQAPPTCSVSQGGVAVPVQMNFIKNKYYVGSYKINIEQPGKAYIDVAGTDIHGMPGKGSVQFIVSDLTANTNASIKVSSDKSTFTILPNSVASNTYIYILPQNENIFDQTTSSESLPLAQFLANRVMAPLYQGNDKSLIEIRQLEEIGPPNLKLTRRIWYSTELLPQDLSKFAQDKVHIYRQTKSGWVFCGGIIKDGKIMASIGGAGRLALMADVTPPQLVRFSPENFAKIDSNFPIVEGKFVDLGSGIATTTFKLFINGKQLSDAIISENGEFKYNILSPLPKGNHRISVEIADKANNYIRHDFTITAPGPFALDLIQVYPNPAKSNFVYFTYNLTQKADEIKLKIYDSAGYKVAEFETSDFSNLLSGKIRWDLTNKKGNRIANGVYIYKFEATKADQKIKHTGKIAVLR